MKEVTGNIWNISRTGPRPYWVVVPTNIGWRDSDGHAVMGRGMALTAMRRYPALAPWYGKLCQQFKAGTGLGLYRELLLFPTKPLNPNQPWRSWMAPSCLRLIERSLQQLILYSPTNYTEVYMPYVGCGNGGLDKEEVRPLLEKYLGDREYITLVSLEERQC